MMQIHESADDTDNVVVLPSTSADGDKPAADKPAKASKKSGAKPAKAKSAASKKPAKKAAAKKATTKKPPAKKKAPAKDKAVKQKKTTKKAAPKGGGKKTRGAAGTKAQTQVEIAAFKQIEQRAKASKVKPADIVRGFIYKGLGYKPAA